VPLSITEEFSKSKGQNIYNKVNKASEKQVRERDLYYEGYDKGSGRLWFR